MPESTYPRKSALKVAVFVTALLYMAGIGVALPWSNKESPEARTAEARRDGKESTGVITQGELQSQVMSFADRFLVLLGDGLLEFEAQTQNNKALVRVRRDAVHSSYACVNIAAQPNPEIALLDMAVLSSLGRMIYEEVHLPAYGASVEGVVRAYGRAEKDIWGVVSRILTNEQQEELRSLIREWRRNHPEVLFFAYIRFNDFAADRRKGALGNAVKSKGMFSSVKDASVEVEKTRLLAERGMFLGTRLPLLTGQFVNLWLSAWVNNPDVEKILDDFHKFSEVSDRLANMSETLPEQIAAERKAAVEQITRSVTKVSNESIRQFMEGLAQERKETLQDLIEQQTQLRGVIVDLKETLREGNALVSSVDTLIARFDTGASDEEAEPDGESVPFDIKDYQATLKTASETVESVIGLTAALDKLLTSPGWEKRMPELVGLIDRGQSETEETLNHAFMLGALFALLCIAVVLLAAVAYRYYTHRYIEQRRRADLS
jgi:hypothetical protein